MGRVIIFSFHVAFIASLASGFAMGEPAMHTDPQLSQSTPPARTVENAPRQAPVPAPVVKKDSRLRIRVSSDFWVEKPLQMYRFEGVHIYLKDLASGKT